AARRLLAPRRARPGRAAQPLDQELRRVPPEMIPPFCNLLVELLKGTALVSLLGVGDVSFAAYLVRLATQDSAQIYSVTLVIYFVLAFAITRGMKALERRTKANLGVSTP
ncbi:hypothetical protein ABZ726_34800, partial [Streptomyces hundungensis]